LVRLLPGITGARGASWGYTQQEALKNIQESVRPDPETVPICSAATLGYLHTGDLRAVQEFLGHADPRMTSRYARVVDMAERNPALFIPMKVG
jgi:integrase